MDDEVLGTVRHPWWERAESGLAVADSGWRSPCYFALRFGQRVSGLMHAPSGATDAAFVFPRCGSVHTFGMEFSIDVLLLDADGLVLRSRRQVRPRRVVEDPDASVAVERESSDDSWPAEGDVVRFVCPEGVRALFSSTQVQALTA